MRRSPGYNQAMPSNPSNHSAKAAVSTAAHLRPLLAPAAGAEAAWAEWMAVLLRRAALVGEEGEVPVAAVVLDAHRRCVGWGSNRRHRHQDPLGHAELMALRQAALLRGSWRFNDCTLIATLEPCPMCAGALVQARMGRVVFAAADTKRGGLGGCLDLSRDASAHHHMEVIAGVLGAEARQQLEQWFRRRRG